MRLRFSKPPFLLMLILAVIIGVLFFINDNRDTGSPTAGTDVAAVQPPTQPAATADATSSAPDDAVTVNQPSSPAAEPSAVAAPRIAPDTQIFIPTAGILSEIVEANLDGNSWDVSQLRTRVGHLQGTSWVGQRGNIVLSGHVEMRDGAPGVFANLNQVSEGDIIELRVNNERRRYLVTEIWSTTPDDLTPVMPSTDERLTLITCGSYNFLQNAYLERLIVVAEPLV